MNSEIKIEELEGILGMAGTGKTTKIVQMYKYLTSKGYEVKVMNPFRALRMSTAKKIAEMSKKNVDEVLRKVKTPFGFGFAISLIDGLLDSSVVVMGKEEYKEFFNRFGMGYNPNVVFNIQFKGNVILTIRDAAVNYFSKPFEDIKEHEFIKFFSTRYLGTGLTAFEVYNIAKALEEYKEDNDYIEYIDMLTMPINTMINYKLENTYLIVDEFQNSTNLIAEFIDKVISPERKIFVGDFNQQVNYIFGGDQEISFSRFRRLIGKIGEGVEVLGKNYRLPENIGKYAEKIIELMKWNVDYSEFVNQEYVKKGGVVIAYKSDNRDVYRKIENIVKSIYGKGSIIIQTYSHAMVENIIKYLTSIGIPTRRSKVSESVLRFYSILYKINRGIFLDNDDIYFLTGFYVGSNFEVIYKNIIENKRFSPSIIPMLIEFADLTDFEKKWIQTMLNNNIPPVSDSVDVMTYLMSPGLTKDYNIVIIDRRKLLSGDEKERDTAYKILYTAITRTNKACYVIMV